MLNHNYKEKKLIMGFAFKCFVLFQNISFKGRKNRHRLL